MLIEDRAKANATILGNMSPYNAYITGAIDQLNRDTQRTWNWIESMMKAYNIEDPITPNKELFFEMMKNEY